MERSFGEIVDSFVDPGFRTGLKRPGLFATTAYRYISHHCHPRDEAFAYGLPNPDAYRLGSRLLGYSHLWHLDVLSRDVRDLRGADPAAALEGGRLEPVLEFPPDTDDLWERARPGFHVAVIRDRRYLAWRYARPGVTYRRFAFRDDAGKLVALFVLRDQWLPGDFLANVTAVADWTAERGHPLVPPLFRAIPRLAAAGGAGKVAFLFTPGCPEWRLAEDAGCLPERTKFRFVGRTYDPENLTLEQVPRAWFVTLGDFDVI
jgi:hypothetical protein